MPQPKSNVEFVTDLMQFGNPLKQVFVIEAIRRYAEDIAENLDPDKADASQWPMISPHGWKAVGVEIHREMEAKYGSVG